MKRFRLSPELILVLIIQLSIILSFSGCGGTTQSAPQYKTMDYNGSTLVYKTSGIPTTNIGNPTILASGKTTDTELIAKIMEVTSQTEAQTVTFLQSYDASSDVIVYELTKDIYVIRHWGPLSKLGRWYAPSFTNQLYLPNEARKLYALPENNNAYNITLYKIKKGTIVVFGKCSDISWNTPTFGSYATGGGDQYFAPKATIWVTDHAEMNPQYAVLVSELRYTK